MKEENKLFTAKEFTAILASLPKTYADVTLDQYLAIMKLDMRGNQENNKLMVKEYHSILSIFCGLPYSELEDKMDFAMTILLIKTLNEGIFATDMKPNLRKDWYVKDIDQMTTNEFIFLMESKTEDVWNIDFIYEYMNTFVYNIRTNERLVFTKEQINEIDVESVNATFFLLILKLEKYIKQSLVKESKRVIKFSWKARRKKVIILMKKLLGMHKKEQVGIY